MVKLKRGIQLLMAQQPIEAKSETSLVVQWLKVHTPNAGGLGSIPDQGTRSHLLQEPLAATKHIKCHS